MREQQYGGSSPTPTSPTPSAAPPVPQAGGSTSRPPQYSAPAGPAAQQYVVTPDGRIVIAGSPEEAATSWRGTYFYEWLSQAIGSINGTDTFNPTTAGSSASAYTVNPPTDMYKPFELLTPEEKNFWKLMQINYHSSSTPESQYAQFVEIAVKQGEVTGVWANPLGIAMRHARDMGYDMRNTYVPGTRTSMAMRRGTATYDIGAYDPKFEGFTGTVGYDQSSGYGGYGGGGGGGGGSSSVDLTNPTTARGLLTQTMQAALGREPSPDEIRDFIKVLNKKQTNNPVTIDASGDAVVRSGGVDPGVIALDYVTAMPEYDEYRGNQYFQTFMSALAGGA